MASILLVPSVTHQTIIVLDFGSQFTQLIARRLRELSVYSEVWPPDTPIEKIRARNPVGIILSGGPKSVSDATAPKCDPAIYALGRPVLGICYGMQLMADQLGGRVAPAPSREFGHAMVSVDRTARSAGGRRSRGALRRRAGRAQGLGEPRRLRRRRAGRLFGRRHQRQRADLRDVGHRARRSTRFCFIRRSSTPSTASRSCATSPTASAAAPATGRWRRSSRRRRRASARQVGSGRVVCALSGGVDSTVAARHHPSRGRQPADLHLRRQRRPAARRGGADPQALRAAAAAAGVRRRVDAVSRSARRRHRSREEAEDHRRDVHRRVRGGGGEARPGGLPRAGHAVSGRHRVDLDRRPVVDDQEPPQRRRPARADAHEADRAAARAVQGRSARGRAQARARRRVRRPPAVPRARGSRSGSSAR